MTKRDKLLCAMLNCGMDGLKMLDDIGYSWDEVLERLDWPDDGAIDFNRLMRGVIDVGIIHIKEAVIDRIYALEAIRLSSQELSEYDEKELESLDSLDPDNDIQSYCNCTDISVWFKRNGGYLQTVRSRCIGIV